MDLNHYFNSGYYSVDRYFNSKKWSKEVETKRTNKVDFYSITI